MRQKGYSKFIRKLEGKVPEVKKYPLPSHIDSNHAIRKFVDQFLLNDFIDEEALMGGFLWASSDIEGINWGSLHSVGLVDRYLLREVCLSWQEQLES